MRHVLDASALLALLHGEPGAERVAAAVGNSFICTINLSEVGAKLLSEGGTREGSQQVIDRLNLTVADFDTEIAWVAAELLAKTKSAGLSLADRACLALAMREGAIALTADRAWTRLDLDCDVELIR